MAVSYSKCMLLLGTQALLRQEFAWYILLYPFNLSLPLLLKVGFFVASISLAIAF